MLWSEVYINICVFFIFKIKLILQLKFGGLTSLFLFLFDLIAIITKAFQGSMRIFSKKLPHPDLVSFLFLIKTIWTKFNISYPKNP